MEVSSHLQRACTEAQFHTFVWETELISYYNVSGTLLGMGWAG